MTAIVVGDNSNHQNIMPPSTPSTTIVAKYWILYSAVRDMV